MLDVKKALVAEAERIAANVQHRVRALEVEFADLERRDIYLDAERVAAKAARERLGRFAARIGRNFQCPRCWVRDGARHTVRAVPSPSDNDLLRCDRCGGDWVVK